MRDDAFCMLSRFRELRERRRGPLVSLTTGLGVCCVGGLVLWLSKKKIIVVWGGIAHTTEDVRLTETVVVSTIYAQHGMHLRCTNTWSFQDLGLFMSMNMIAKARGITCTTIRNVRENQGSITSNSSSMMMIHQ